MFADDTAFIVQVQSPPDNPMRVQGTRGSPVSGQRVRGEENLMDIFAER